MFSTFQKIGFDWTTFWLDITQRSILFTDVMIDRGADSLDGKNRPNVISSSYTVILDGEDFEKRPCNYKLVKLNQAPGFKKTRKRPFIGISPRAGRRAGIEASMTISQASVALKLGYEAYWIIFDPKPIPGQTIEDVIWAMGIFIEKVNSLHEDAPEGAVVMANCQAGWATFFSKLKKNDLPFTLIPIGSPLSYWSGEKGEDSLLRFMGAPFGGSWLTAFIGDLNSGNFDGANLAGNFMAHSLPNALHGKWLRTFLSVDNKAEDFILMEQWWNVFTILEKEEILWILTNLFIGNKPERGLLEIEGEVVDMRKHGDLIVIFGSKGDKISSPAQCLGWIQKVYANLEELKKSGKKIVYLLHPDAGHLKIFFSGTVARDWHGPILDNIQMLEELPPGLFQATPEKDGFLTINERTFEDLPASDPEAEAVLQKIADVSEKNQALYDSYLKPATKAMGRQSFVRALLKILHPLRLQRYPFKGHELNPWFQAIKMMIPVIKAHRVKVDEENGNIFFNSFVTTNKKLNKHLTFMSDSQKSLAESMTRGWFASSS